MNTWILLLALFASCVATYNCGHCATGQCYGSPNQCHQCDTNYYLGTDGNCAICNGAGELACPTGQFRNLTLCGPCSDDGCRSCSTVAPCPLGQYWDASRCGNPALHMYHDSGCRVCQDCVTSEGVRAKAWGVCGGPSPYTYNPEPTCLAPGVALCEVCSAYVPGWAYTQEGTNDTFCDDMKDDDWLFLSGKDEDDLVACCHGAHALEADSSSSGCAYCTVPAVKSCLYNYVMTCLGIYTPPPTGTGWPLPHAYPPESTPPPASC